ncbi:MAG: hypothetical protein OHK0031_01050 [Anaerolineales bacterium]
MNRRLAWQTQMIFGLFCGLLMGWLFSLAQTVAATPPPAAQAWFVQLRISAAAPPLFEKVQPSGLMPDPTPAAAADSALELLDEGGAVLWRYPFRVSFNLDDLPSPAPYRVFSFIVPALPGARLLRLSTPSGAASYALP